MGLSEIYRSCISKNQKDIFTMWVLLRRKSWKRAEAMQKKYPWAEGGICVFVCERENKITALK